MLCELRTSAAAEEWQVTDRTLSLMDEPPRHPFKGPAGPDGRDGWHRIDFKHQRRIDGEVGLGIWKDPAHKSNPPTALAPTVHYLNKN